MALSAQMGARALKNNNTATNKQCNNVSTQSVAMPFLTHEGLHSISGQLFDQTKHNKIKPTLWPTCHLILTSGQKMDRVHSNIKPQLRKPGCCNQSPRIHLSIKMQKKTTAYNISPDRN